MAVALSSWMLTVISYVFLRGRVRFIGRFLATGALLLCPTAAGTALELLSCNRVPLSSAAVSALDGGNAYVSSNPREVVSVLLLSSNPDFICFAGSHKPAAWLAIVTVALYISILPFVMLFWLWRDVALRKMLVDIKHPMPEGLACLRRFRPNLPEIQPAADPHLSPFISDSGYQPHYWWFRLVDLGATLILALIQAFLPRPVLASQVCLCKSTKVMHSRLGSRLIQHIPLFW